MRSGVKGVSGKHAKTDGSLARSNEEKVILPSPSVKPICPLCNGTVCPGESSRLPYVNRDGLTKYIHSTCLYKKLNVVSESGRNAMAPLRTYVCNGGKIDLLSILGKCEDNINLLLSNKQNHKELAELLGNIIIISKENLGVELNVFNSTPIEKLLKKFNPN